MSKKSFSPVVALVVLISAILVPAFVSAAPFVAPVTSTNITNTAPTLGAVAESWTQSYTGTATTDARTESSSDYPTNAGSVVTFTGTADDPNGDPYYLAICKTAAVTAGNNAAPTCDGGAWGISAETADNVAATVTYTTLTGDVEANSWYAYACDKISGGTGLCSVASISSQGGTHAEAGTTPTASGSPFHVNHIPSFTSGTIVDSTDGTIQPNETVKFVNSADADTDTNATQDTITLYVCSGEADMGGVTTAFDFRSNSCTGGTLLCTATGVNPSAANATCNDTTSLVAAPTAHKADYTVMFYVEDAHSFAATDTATKDFEVTDVAPTLVSYTATDNPAAAAGLSDTVDFSVSIADLNGDNDVQSVEGVFFDKDAVTAACTADENNCYIQTTCTLGTQSTGGAGHESMGTDTGYTAACQVTVWFNANASSNWEVHANPTDDGVKTSSFADSDANRSNAALAAINIVEGTIAYGTVSLGGTSNAQTTTMQNYGNSIIDVLIQGTDMTGTPSGTIVAAQQHWHETNSSFTYGSGDFALVTSAAAGAEALGCSNRDLAVRNVHNLTAEDESMYWRIQIPASQTAGSYTGLNTFASTASTSCTGTAH